MSEPTEAAFWDHRYHSQAALWSGEPNPLLIEQAGELRPGRALDAGCGEGADAIWLAERGWRVTGADLSAVALERAKNAARAAGVAERIAWQCADLLTAPSPALPYDLISAHFIHLPPDQRRAFVIRLAGWVAPGGTLLIVGHHPSDLATTVRRPRMPGVLFEAAAITELLDPGAWTIALAAACERAATGADGCPARVHDTVVRAVRRTAPAPAAAQAPAE